jgi:hypothetical protein
MSYKNCFKDDFETPGNYFIENDDTKMDFSEEDNNTPTGDGTEIEYQKIFDNTKFETNQDYETDESIFRQSSNDFCPAPPQINNIITKHDDCNDFGCPETPEGQGNLFRNSNVVNINEINYNGNCNYNCNGNGNDYCVNLPTPSFSTVSTPTSKKIKFNVVSLQNLTKNEKLGDDETIYGNNNNNNNNITKFPILQNTNNTTTNNNNTNNTNTINSDFDPNKITTNSITSNSIKKKFSVSLIKYQNPTRRFKPDSIRKKIKSRTHKHLRNLLNDYLRKAKSKMIFDYFPQSFVSNVKININKSVLNLTLRELYLKEFKGLAKDKEKEINNKKVIYYLEKNKEIGLNSGVEKLLNYKYKEILKLYFNSDLFKNDLCRLKDEGEDDEYINKYKYLALNWCDFYEQSGKNNIQF